jgi:hypothetical protein
MLVTGNLIKRADRVDVSITAKLQIGGNLFACSMQNLSVGGAKVVTDMPMNRGDDLELAIGEFKPIPCHVVWARPPLFGLKFKSDVQEEVADILMSVATYSGH